jgi:hypothetical protein
MRSFLAEHRDVGPLGEDQGTRQSRRHRAADRQLDDRAFEPGPVARARRASRAETEPMSQCAEMAPMLRKGRRGRPVLW